ncbi:hypothetical protein [Paractinoplanes toevensis]|uniref:Uncharacterized protein n=1 Tax=Paractinoplanes toevensis TaxID=571911 RepID=A0A919TD43_9ACTN|nr:hypothetical protein [Actinoplanes toevensis]GIM91979.1 hypothetical protein Ato02nite_037720 [Actinoplanes toevensis]
MNGQQTGGFAGDPADALAVAGTGGCCGNPPSSTLQLPQAASSPCCGTSTDAAAASSCCGNAAKSEAVTSGQGCCG